jgi:hypothetical protein
MSNRVRFNENVEIRVFEKDDPPLDVKKERLINLYDKWSKYLFGILIILLIIYLFAIY